MELVMWNFVKLLDVFLSLWNWFGSWNFLRGYFYLWNLIRTDLFFLKLVAFWFVSLWNLYIDFSPCETILVMSYAARILLLVDMLLFSSWNLKIDFFPLLKWNLLRADYLFVKLVACWVFTSWNQHIEFSSCQTHFVQELVACWFLSWKLLRAVFSVLENFFMLIFLFMRPVINISSRLNWFFSWNLLHADFYSWNLLSADFFGS